MDVAGPGKWRDKEGGPAFPGFLSRRYRLYHRPGEGLRINPRGSHGAPVSVHSPARLESCAIPAAQVVKPAALVRGGEAGTTVPGGERPLFFSS